MMEVSTLTSVAFWIVSAVILNLAVIVVTQQNVYRAAIALAGTFLAVGILYFILSAEFVGVVQILVYVGAISVLLAFAVMFIQDVTTGSRPSQGRAVGGTMAALLFAALVFASYNSDWTSIDSITDETARAALTDGFVEVGDGDNLIVAAPGLVDADSPIVENDGVLVNSTGPLGVLLTREYVLAFEVIGLLLVAALLGGLLLMRDPENEEAEA
jgi:NADH:ubiquinone oxidoreductase subunit 6 (subunit J)